GRRWAEERAWVLPWESSPEKTTAILGIRVVPLRAARCSGPGGRAQKSPRCFHRRLSGIACCLAQDLDLVSLHALLALDGFEGNLLAFLQAAEAAAFNGTEVHEQIRTAQIGRASCREGVEVSVGAGPGAEDMAAQEGTP